MTQENVCDFEAIGDGINKDTAALQAAIDAIDFDRGCLTGPWKPAPTAVNVSFATANCLSPNTIRNQQ